MCGIAGHFSKYGTTQHFEPVLKSFKHRGPDQTVVTKFPHLTIGSNRLAINDLSNGNQPFYNTDKNVIVFYNGEIYNYLELRYKLEKSGFTFKSHVDGEVIPYLYLKYGESFAEHLDGMFAISLYDLREDKLLLTRDIAGEKPLYYSQPNSDTMYFSSTIMSLLKFPEIDQSLNLQAIWDLPTFLWIPEPSTIFEAISAVMPGETIVHDGVSTKKLKYELPLLNLTNLKYAEKIELTQEIVTKSIKSTLMSDVPIGSFLSSGLDSSIVTAIASENVEELHTFTIAFQEGKDPIHGSLNEAPLAAHFAKKLGTIHHEILVTPDSIFEDLGDFVKFADQPFAVTSGMGVKRIAKEANLLGVKVLLSGDGADELFGGYSWYEHLIALTNAQPGVVRNIRQTPISNFSSNSISNSDKVAMLAKYDLPTQAWALHYYASEFDKSQIFSKDIGNQIESSMKYFDHFKEIENPGPIDFINHDREMYLPQEMLRKVDRMTMAHSVEGRVPFVTKDVMSLAKSLEFASLVNGRNLKHILRESFKNKLPKHIIERNKHGFNFPIEQWLRSNWSNLIIETFGRESQIVSQGIVSDKSMKYTQELLMDKDKLNGHTIFAFIVLEQWLKEFGKEQNHVNC